MSEKLQTLLITNSLKKNSNNLISSYEIPLKGIFNFLILPSFFFGNHYEILKFSIPI